MHALAILAVVVSQYCTEKPPATKWDPPLCMDEKLDISLMHAAERGEEGALAMVRARYETARTKVPTAISSTSRLPGSASSTQTARGRQSRKRSRG